MNKLSYFLDNAIELVQFLNIIYSPAVNCLTKIKFKIIPAKIELNFLNFNGTVLKQHIFIEQIFIAH